MISYQFGLLCIDRIAELQKGLKLIVLGKCDYLHDCAKLGENLETNQGNININIQILNNIYSQTCQLNHLLLRGITTTDKSFICRSVNRIRIRHFSLQFNAKTLLVKLS